jgi:hypothetical protein
MTYSSRSAPTPPPGHCYCFNVPVEYWAEMLCAEVSASQWDVGEELPELANFSGLSLRGLVEPSSRKLLQNRDSAHDWSSDCNGLIYKIMDAKALPV